MASPSQRRARQRQQVLTALYEVSQRLAAAVETLVEAIAHAQRMDAEAARGWTPEKRAATRKKMQERWAAKTDAERRAQAERLHAGRRRARARED